MKWTDDEFYRLKKVETRAFKKFYTEFKDTVYNYLMVKANGDTNVVEEVFIEGTEPTEYCGEESRIDDLY